MNYFDVYKIILETIKNDNPQDFQSLLNCLYKDKKVKKYVDDDKTDNQVLIKTFMHTLKNMINDGLVLGNITPTKQVTLIRLDGLSTVGYTYLIKLKDKKFTGKLKSTLKSEGVPMTPQSLTKFLAQMIF